MILIIVYTNADSSSCPGRQLASCPPTSLSCDCPRMGLVRVWEAYVVLVGDALRDAMFVGYIATWATMCRLPSEQQS